MKKISFILCLSVLLLASCTDARKARIGGFNDEFSVELVNCEGEVYREYTSTGKVLSEESSDGYYFKDKKSGKLIEVTGNLIITKK